MAALAPETAKANRPGDNARMDVTARTGGAQMAVYIIASIDITDPEDYQEYARQAGATVAQYGGRYLARGSQIETIEG
ncbi:DUF1330 domain-containing protein, partial [Thermogemmatispora sp.]|uniref:DUF1330 domain-containing protein n=1 Tax=Thermogemmatispora sp. TaxID=1968838 RepID=UPI003A102FA5